MAEPSEAEQEVDSSQDPTDPRMQLEMVLFKFPSLGRESLQAALEEFLRFDGDDKGNLTLREGCQLLEYKGNTKTHTELVAMIEEIDKDNDRHISFLEWCCCNFELSWVELHDFSDEAARAAAMRAIAEAREAQIKAEEEIAAAKRAEEEAAAKRAAELEAEAKLTGVAGAAAFFARQMEASQDTTQTNEERIKAEAARRRALREAKKKEREAAEAAQSAGPSREEVEAELREAQEKADRERAEEEARKKEEEDRKRREFREKQRSMWENK